MHQITEEDVKREIFALMPIEFTKQEKTLAALSCIETFKKAKRDKLDRRCEEIKLRTAMEAVIGAAIEMRENGSLNYYSMNR